MPAPSSGRGSTSTSRAATAAPTYLEQFRETIRLTGMLTEEQVAPDAARDRCSACSGTGETSA